MQNLSNVTNEIPPSTLHNAQQHPYTIVTYQEPSTVYIIRYNLMKLIEKLYLCIIKCLTSDELYFSYIDCLASSKQYFNNIDCLVSSKQYFSYNGCLTSDVQNFSYIDCLVLSKQYFRHNGCLSSNEHYFSYIDYLASNEWFSVILTTQCRMSGFPVILTT